jgi:hypothetical protein
MVDIFDLTVAKFTMATGATETVRRLGYEC